MPRTASWSLIVADLTRGHRTAKPPPGRAAPPPGDHLEGVHARARLVDAHGPDPQEPRQGGQRDVGVLAVEHRPRPTVLVGEERTEERLAARPEEDRQAQLVELDESLQQLPVVLAG